MSSQQPINAQSRELEVLRVLFDRGLLERAVSLAESRWTGSGDMVRLAYEWSQLSPTMRRERLSQIGPEEVARLRELASLNPEFEAVVQNLDQRGVLPHAEQMAASGVAAAATAQATRLEAAPEPGEAAVAADLPTPQAAVPDSTPIGPTDDPRVSAEVQARVDAVNAAAQQRIEALRREAEQLERMDPTQLAAGAARLENESQQVARFLSAEQGRRQEAFADAEAAMERVRQRLDRTSNELLLRGDVAGRPALPSLDPALLPVTAGLAGAAAGARRALPAAAPARLVAAPERLARDFAEQIVVTLIESAEFPTDDELVALANELGLALREFIIAPGKTRAVFGGLTRTGQRIEAVAGPLPSALAGETLAVVRGALYSNLVERMRLGFADIPGTRATVRMHPKSRVLVLID